MVQAAWMVDGVVYAGRSHLNILAVTAGGRDIRHGYVSDHGHFAASLEESMRDDNCLIAVRHAESRYNVNLTEDLDSDLTDRGQRQCLGLAEYLRASGDAVGFTGYVSPFRRTLDTALAIHRAVGVPFRVVPVLAEYGADWGRQPHHIHVPNRSAEYPMFDWSAYTAGVLFTGENYERFLDRVRQALSMVLFSELGSHKALVVSHGAVVHTLIDLLTEGRVLKGSYGSVTNASVSLVCGKTPEYIFKQDWMGDLS